MYRKWTINDKTIESESKITIYDAGAYVCEMLGDTYTCWEVVSREKGEDGSITELLQPVEGDWTPFDIISSESYPVNVIDGGYEITGWTITLEPRASQQPSQPRQQPRQQPYQQPRQQHSQRLQQPHQRPSQQPQQHQGLPGRPRQQPYQRPQQPYQQRSSQPQQKPRQQEAP